MVSKLAYTGLAMFVLLAVPAPVQQEAAGTRVIVQNPRAVHCYQLPYADCVRCARARGFSPAEYRPYCRMRHLTG